VRTETVKKYEVGCLSSPRGLFDSSCFIQGPPICYQPSTLNNTPKNAMLLSLTITGTTTTYKEGGKELQMIFFIFDE